jgi:phosphatidylethanolamine-binding protein (PEBP) family uncharacterized protein
MNTINLKYTFIIFTLLTLLNSCSDDEVIIDEEETISEFVLTSAAIVDGYLIDDYKCESETQNDLQNSIPLTWSNVPEGTGSFIVIMYGYATTAPDFDPTADPDAQLLIWRIESDITEIPWGEAGNTIGVVGANRDGHLGYKSPCSPSSGEHEYTLAIYALSETPSSLPTINSTDVDYASLIEAIESVTVLGIAELPLISLTE